MFQQHPFWHWLSNCTLFLSSFRMCSMNLLMFDDSTTIYDMFPPLFSLWFLGHCHALLLFELLSKGICLTIAIPEKINTTSFYVLFLRLAYPLHRIEFALPKFFSKTFRFPIIFYSTLQKNEGPRGWNFWTKKATKSRISHRVSGGGSGSTTVDADPKSALSWTHKDCLQLSINFCHIYRVYRCTICTELIQLPAQSLTRESGSL